MWIFFFSSINKIIFKWKKDVGVSSKENVIFLIFFIYNFVIKFEILINKGFEMGKTSNPIILE